MKSIQLNNLFIPLALVNSLNFTKSAVTVKHGLKAVRATGTACRSLNVSFVLNQSTIGLFRNENHALQDASLGEIVQYFVQKPVETSLDMEPYHIYIDGSIIIPELLFLPTSISTTTQTDANGNIVEAQIDLVLSGVKATKLVSRPKKGVVLASDERSYGVSLHKSGQTLLCENDISIREYVLTPTTLNLGLVLADSSVSKVSSDWTSLVEGNAVVNTPYGRFYVINASFEEDYLALECTVFTPEARELVNKTYMDTTLQAVLKDLKLDIESYLEPVPIDYYRAEGSSVDILKDLSASLGFLVAFQYNSVILFEAPKEMPEVVGEVISTAYDDMNRSEEPGKIIWTDGVTRFEDGEGSLRLLESRVRTRVNRLPNIRNAARLQSSNLRLNVSLDLVNLLPWTYVNVEVEKEGTKAFAIQDYTADILNNTVELLLAGG